MFEVGIKRQRGCVVRCELWFLYVQLSKRICRTESMSSVKQSISGYHMQMRV
jgi:hypothetical protein